MVKIPATIPIHVPEDISGGGGSVGTLTITWKVRQVYQGNWKQILKNDKHGRII